MRGVHNGLGDLPLQAGRLTLKPCLEEVNVARIAQVDFGIDGYVGRKFDLQVAGHKSHRTNETGRHPAANNCSGLVPVPATPGAENLTSRRPSSLRETPPRRPPRVCVLAVYFTFITSWAEPATVLVS